MAILNCKAGLIQERKGQYQSAINWLEEALAVMDTDMEETAGINYAMAGVLYRMGQHSQAMEWCNRGLDIAREVSSDTEIAHGYYLLGTLYTELGNTDKAISFRERALDTYEKLGDMIGQARVHNNLGVDYYYYGDWERAKTHYNKSLEIREKIGDINGVAPVSNNLGEILSDQGYCDEAITSFQTCLKTWQRIGYHLGVGLANSNLGRAYTRKHQGETALELIGKAMKIFEEVGSGGFILECNYRLAEAYFELSQYQKALDYCETALNMAREGKIPLIEAAVLRVKSQTLQRLGRINEAVENIRESRNILEKINAPYELACTLWELALICAEESDESTDFDRETNRDLFIQSVETFTRLGILRHRDQIDRLNSFYKIDTG